MIWKEVPSSCQKTSVYQCGRHRRWQSTGDVLQYKKCVIFIFTLLAVHERLHIRFFVIHSNVEDRSLALTRAGVNENVVVYINVVMLHSPYA